MQPDERQPYPDPVFEPGAPRPFPLRHPLAGEMSRRRARRRLAAAMVALLVLGVGGWGVYARWIRTDPGIAACERMADGKPPVDTGEKSAGFTEAEYRRIRDTFADSRHEDIRAAGTRMADVAWQAQQAGGADSVGAALAFGGQASEALTAMAGACANHGIVVRLGGR